MLTFSDSPDINQLRLGPCWPLPQFYAEFSAQDLIDCLKNYGHRFVTLYRGQWSKQSQGKEMQKGKMIVWGGLTNNWEKRGDSQRGKGEIYTLECRVPPLECRVPKNNEERESLPQWSMQRNRGNNRMGKTKEISSRKLEIPREHFMQRWAR